MVVIKRIFLIAFAAVLFPGAQALPTLEPAHLEHEANPDGTVLLRWTLPGPADQVRIAGLQADGNISTWVVPGEWTEYTVQANSAMTYWVTYTHGGNESLPSNPVVPLLYPYCPNFILIDQDDVPPVYFNKDCTCPMPVVGNPVCFLLPILFR